MRTTNDSPLCPYTGLRSFTEEESLYFKGRDLQVDQITALLEQNKFLMVTGASGEGKSSLIYAGLIPNARAGFFKARYSNWVIADFRPERNPVSNMAHAIADKFSSNPASIETELRRGYSSLIDLYTNSSFYLGEEENVPDGQIGQESKDRKRKASNLLIIVDQFEEFFTNPENFYNESPSNDSQIVVNLILETSRIAIQKNLPVYVICTMRSDYIGQCSAFRGLPEYIGFSQFFVPRLKRKDLKQVIEEPALLSGIKISQRLIERLVFDISEGVDQLPILQHALSRIWMEADQGREELDLIHYAKVGGMPASDLPDEDIPRFNDWLKKRPEEQQRFYTDTGLAKIIEIHANLLYENAWQYYNGQNPENPVSQQDAKRIIAISFSCLTKIDNSRAVRNRMSLEEITAIINRPVLMEQVVGEVLNIFREEGNSFIRPFKTGDPATFQLSPGTVLDITHESLIRNWNKLNQWANREFEYYTTLLDFLKQMERWKKSGRSRGYLLPVGPLSYFENWYKKCNPNAGWIKRYAEKKEDPALADQHSRETLTDIREFLKRSASKEMVTRAFMKYGPQRIASFFAILVMLVLTGFYWFNADKKKNARVIEKIKSQSQELLSSTNVNLADKAIYLLAEERQDSGSMMSYLESLPVSRQISLDNELYKQILSFNKHLSDPLKDSIFAAAYRNLNNPALQSEPKLLLNENNKFQIELAMDQYFMPDHNKSERLSDIADKNYNTVMQFVKNTALYNPAVPTELNMAIQLWLSFGRADSSRIHALLQQISPLEGNEGNKTFNKYYIKGTFEIEGRLPLNFNGGYHELACLYAALGDLNKLFRCFEIILANNGHDYFEMPRVLNNHLNVLEYLYQFGHRDQVPAYLAWLQKNTADNPPATILRNAILRAGYISHMYTINIYRSYYRSTRGYLFPNLCLCDRSIFDAMEEDYEKVILSMKNPSQRDYTLALNDKRKAMFYSKYWYDRQIKPDEQKLDEWLGRSVSLYRKLDSSFLEGTESSTVVYNGDGVRTGNIKRKNLLIYPDYKDGWFSWSFHTDYFFKYLMKNDLLPVYFKTAENLEQLHFWVAKAFEWKPDIAEVTYGNIYPLPDETLKNILAFVNQHPEGNTFDKNLIYGVLANRAFGKGDIRQGLEYYQHLDIPNLRRTVSMYEYLEQNFILNTLKMLCVHLASIGKTKLADPIAAAFPSAENRIYCYLQMAHQTYTQNASPVTFSILDSVDAISKRIDYNTLTMFEDCRADQILVLSQIGSRSLNDRADEILKDIPEENRFSGILAKVDGIAVEGNYFRAMSSIPKSLTESQDLQCRSAIILENCRAKESVTEKIKWQPFDDYMNRNFYFTNFSAN